MTATRTAPRLLLTGQRRYTAGRSILRQSTCSIAQPIAMVAALLAYGCSLPYVRLQVRVALQALEEQSGSGFVRCLVGHGDPNPTPTANTLLPTMALALTLTLTLPQTLLLPDPTPTEPQFGPLSL